MMRSCHPPATPALTGQAVSGPPAPGKPWPDLSAALGRTEPEPSSEAAP